MTSRMTGPRRLPTWTVPDGVFESLTTCGPRRPEPRVRPPSPCSPRLVYRGPPQHTDASVRRSEAELRAAIGPRILADADDLVGEVAGGDLHDDLLALLLAEQGAPDRALVGDPALGRLGLGGADDRERLLAVGALDRDGRADLDVVGRVVLVDDRGVLDQRLERLDPALDERLLVLGVLVLGVLGQVAVFLGVVDPVGDLGSLDARPSRRAPRGASRGRPWRGRWACCSRPQAPVCWWVGCGQTVLGGLG